MEEYLNKVYTNETTPFLPSNEVMSLTLIPIGYTTGDDNVAKIILFRQQCV